MKKTLLISALFTSLVINAQVPDKGTLEVAPVIGVAFSNYVSDYGYSSNDPIVSSTVGVDLDVYFSKNWSLRSGLHYQIMGTEYYTSPGWTTERLDYLTLPVHANIHFGRKKNWNAHFGPSFSFLLNAESESNSYVNQNIENSVNNFQLGFGFGIGHKIQLNDFMALGLQYNHLIGLTRANRYSDYNYYNNYYYDYYYHDNDDIRNNFGSFAVSLIFRLGHKQNKD